MKREGIYQIDIWVSEAINQKNESEQFLIRCRQLMMLIHDGSRIYLIS